MSRSSSFSLAVRGLAFSALALGGVSSALMLACGDVGDATYVPPTVAALNQVDLDNAPFCVGTCRPDYGSQRINCTAEAGLEFFPVDVLNGDSGTVTGFYAYNDGTADFMQAGPAAFDGNAITTNDPSSTGVTNYEPLAVQVNDRCGPDGQPNGTDNVQHLRGGIFYEWGGGMGRRLTNFVTAATPACPPAGAGPNDPDYCPDPDPRIESVADRPENPTLRSDFYGMVADLRGWEGISFWARQGPNNTGGIRVYVGDRQLDEDIAFLEQNAGLTPMCQRAKECGCRNHRPCTPDTIQRAAGPRVELSCWDPALGDPSPSQLQTASGLGTAFINPYDICGDFLCDAINPAWQIPDPLFSTPAATPPGTAQCQLYKLTNDLEEYYCYDANKPESFPPDQPQRCGDGWEKGVALSTDWQFYKVPFTELRQEGYGQEFSYLDLSAITLVRFTWTQGWVDVWLDDVRFYRHPGFAAALTP
ncbi:MAG TPA: hypothetical protein VJU61_01385 [Polyangiaceae bacterium]|nr:hypothetical protein [Polyangiaceae bacterium]